MFYWKKQKILNNYKTYVKIDHIKKLSFEGQ